MTCMLPPSPAQCKVTALFIILISSCKILMGICILTIVKDRLMGDYSGVTDSVDDSDPDIKSYRLMVIKMAGQLIIGTEIFRMIPAILYLNYQSNTAKLRSGCLSCLYIGINGFFVFLEGINVFILLVLISLEKISPKSALPVLSLSLVQALCHYQLLRFENRAQLVLVPTSELCRRVPFQDPYNRV